MTCASRSRILCQAVIAAIVGSAACTGDAAADTARTTLPPSHALTAEHSSTSAHPSRRMWRSGVREARRRKRRPIARTTAWDSTGMIWSDSVCIRWSDGTVAFRTDPPQTIRPTYNGRQWVRFQLSLVRSDGAAAVVWNPMWVMVDNWGAYVPQWSPSGTWYFQDARTGSRYTSPQFSVDPLWRAYYRFRLGVDWFSGDRIVRSTTTWVSVNGAYTFCRG